MRQALNQLSRINSTTRVVMAVYGLQDLVRDALEEGKMQDEGQWDKDLQYVWKAEPLRTGRNALAPSEYGAGIELGNFKLTLYRITLVVGKKGASPPRPQSFRYDELVFKRMSP